MSDKKKKVLLERAMTYAGTNYAPGLNEMPEAAAASAVKRKLGVLADQKSEGGEQSAAAADFKPLPFQETMKRFEDGDASAEVFDSLKFYQPKIAEAKKAGMTVSEFLAVEPVGENGGGSQTEGLPEDFPMRHVFEKLGLKTVEEIQGKSFDELVALDGIAEASATKALAYGK